MWRRRCLACGEVTSVAGRYTQVERRGRPVRLLLAKNPAGWLEAFDVLDPPPTPIVLAVNAQEPDGKDTSWLWDVDYRVLRGRRVFVTGERRLDLAVRLEADGIAFRTGQRHRRGGGPRRRQAGRARQLHGVPADPRHAWEGVVTGRPLRLVWVYPDLLSTYGDRGNLLVLERRARLRGIPTHARHLELRPAGAHATVDIYLMGGGEDLPQILAARRLRADGGLPRRPLPARLSSPCARAISFLARSSAAKTASRCPASGCSISAAAAGNGAASGRFSLTWTPPSAYHGLPDSKIIRASPTSAQARGRCRARYGASATETAPRARTPGRVLGTYLHGPALVRNPALADLLLSWAVGPLGPVADRTRNGHGGCAKNASPR